MALDVNAHTKERRAIYRFWWEYLRLAHEVAALEYDQDFHNDADKKFINAVKVALRNSKKYYASWHLNELSDFKNFKVWFKEHAELFQEEFVVRELAHGKKPQDKDAIVVEVPLRFSKREIARQMQKVVDAAYKERDARTKAGKSRKRTSAKYSLSVGQFKVDQIKEYLTIYSNIQMLNLKGKLVAGQTAKVRGVELLQAVNKFYTERDQRRGEIQGIFEIEEVRRANGRLDGDANENQMRSVNRYIGKAANIILNVAGGEFTGDYE